MPVCNAWENWWDYNVDWYCHSRGIDCIGGLPFPIPVSLLCYTKVPERQAERPVIVSFFGGGMGTKFWELQGLVIMQCNWANNGSYVRPNSRPITESCQCSTCCCHIGLVSEVLFPISDKVDHDEVIMIKAWYLLGIDDDKPWFLYMLQVTRRIPWYGTVTSIMLPEWLTALLLAASLPAFSQAQELRGKVKPILTWSKLEGKFLQFSNTPHHILGSWLHLFSSTSPWYYQRGWLGVKNQSLTELLPTQ